MPARAYALRKRRTPWTPARCCYPPGPPSFSSSSSARRRIFDEPGGSRLPRFARCCYPPGPPSFSSSKLRPTADLRRARGFAAASLCSLPLPPWTPFFLLLEAPPDGGSSTSQGVRGCLALLVAATPLDPLLSPPRSSARRRIFDEPGGSRLPRFARCCYPPGPPSFSSSKLRPTADLRRARGFAAASLRSLLLSPWTPFFLLLEAPPDGGSSTSQGVRSCLASLVAATPPDPLLSPPRSSARRRIFDEPGGPQLPRFARCCYPPGPPSFSSSKLRPTADLRRARGSAAASLRSLLLPPRTPFFLLLEAPPDGGSSTSQGVR